MFRFFLFCILLWPVEVIAADDYLILPGERVGFITVNTTEEDIKNHVKPEEYKREIIQGREGFRRWGMILYPGTDREMTIYWKSETQEVSMGDWWKKGEENWKEPPVFRNPQFVYIENSHSPWHTAEGVKINSTLEKLEQLNGRPFTFFGWGWDGSGMLYSWEDGKLSPFLYPQLNVIGWEKNGAPNSVTGEKELRSDSPAVRSVKWKTVSLRILFP
jgi:hypothetical protein